MGASCPKLEIVKPRRVTLRRPTVLDLFSGCGGLSFGFASEGFEILAGVDSWQDALITFAKNHPSAMAVAADLGDPSVIKEFASLPELDVVVGGPPCQGFSLSGKRDPDDPRNRLYEGFVDAVRILRPAFFVMENVPNLRSMAGGEIGRSIIADFDHLGYRVVDSVLLASNFGVPQNRRRLFIVGQRIDAHLNDFVFPSNDATNVQLSSSDAISDLPENSVADGTGYLTPPRSDFQAKMREKSSGIWNHEITIHTEKTRRIIALVPDGGNYKDLPVELQGTRKVNIAWTRLSSDRPSFTIDTGHRHHFHYEYNRVPTVRESARLQSFPDHFHFEGTKTSQLKQVGNAVPPLLAASIARQIRLCLSRM